MQRTITLHLPDNPVLAETIRQFNDCCNYFLQLGFGARTFHKRELQRLGYYEARARWPRLQSSLIQGARDCAHDMLKREDLNRLPRKRVGSAARFNQRTFSAFFQSGVLSLSTIQGRKRFPLRIPAYFHRYLEGRATALRMRVRESRIVVDLVMTLPDPLPRASKDPSVLGIDRGIINVAVASNGHFFRSSELRMIQGRHAYLRARLQAAGTRSAKRHLMRLAGRERRFQANSNHVIAKKVAALDFDVLALEALSLGPSAGNGRSLNKKLGRWAFAQLGEFLTYKCEELGKRVVLVPPQYTSKICSRCGRFGERIRSEFSCQCGNKLNADLNAARNIAKRGKSLLGRRPVNPPIVTRNEAGFGNLAERSCKLLAHARVVDHVESPSGYGTMPGSQPRPGRAAITPGRT